MLRISTKNDGANEIWELEGKLSGEWADELRRFWNERASRGAEERSGQLQVQLKAVSYIDAAGKKVLTDMYAAGVEIRGCGCLTRAVVEDVVREGRSRGGSGIENATKKLLALLMVAGFALGGASLKAQNLPASESKNQDLKVQGSKTQEPPPLSLTLGDAVSLALRQNPQVQIAALNYAESIQDKNISRSNLLPQAAFGVTESVSRLNFDTFVGKPIAGFPQAIGPFQVFQAGPQFSVPVLDLTLWRRYQAAKHTTEASRADQDSVREQLVLLVISQYLGCLRSTALVQAAKSRVELGEALFGQASDLQKGGAGTGIDTLRANVELQNEKQRLLQAETDQKTSMYGLVRLLNLDPRQEIAFNDALSFFETPESPATDSLTNAYASRPELRALDARARSLRSDQQAVSESRLPAMRFAGNWAYAGLSTSTGIPTYQYAVSIGFPLLTGGRIRAENVRADLALKKIAQQRADLQNQIALEVKTGAANLASARQQVDVANLGVSLAREEVVQARDRFSAGVANNIEVISAQDALARASDNQVAALYGYNQARADLARATGQIESVYTGAKPH